MKLNPIVNNDHVMSQFDMLQPVFLNDDDLPPSSPDYCASLSEEIWKKFELLPTPPRSPEHPGSADQELCSDNDDFISAASYDSDYASHIDYCSDGEESKNCAYYTSDCTVQTSNSVYEIKSELIKDCMWNGVGHKPHSEVSRTADRVRNLSPCAAAKLNAKAIINGCVDPKTVFACRKNLKQPKQEKSIIKGKNQYPRLVSNQSGMCCCAFKVHFMLHQCMPTRIYVLHYVELVLTLL